MDDAMSIEQAEPILWAPRYVLEARAHEINEARLRQARISATHAAYKNPFQTKITRMLYLVATGYGDEAGNIAREVATAAYDEYLDRQICEHTGNVYFHACEESW